MFESCHSDQMTYDWRRSVAKFSRQIRAGTNQRQHRRSAKPIAGRRQRKPHVFQFDSTHQESVAFGLCAAFPEAGDFSAFVQVS